MATEKGLKLAARLWGWRPHSEGQRQWLTCDAKVKVAACGRRWGKSESTAIDIALYALENPGTTQIIIAPTDDQTRIIMSEVRRRFYGIPAFDGCFTDRQAPYPEIYLHDAHKSKEPTAILTRTAGVKGKGIRGRKAHRVIVDEAAYVPDSVMQEVITPLLADFDGQLIEISTPGGRNHFWHAYHRGLDELQPRFAAFQFPTSENPYIPKSYLEAERESKPERVFQQEYLALFLEEEGSVFRGVSAVVDKGRTENEPAERNHRYTAGCDLARVEDFTVISVTDQTGRQVYFERFNQISWERQIAAIDAVASRYNATVHLDSTGVGDPIFERLKLLAPRGGYRVEPFVFTNQSKQELIDNLAMEIEQAQVSLMDIPAQTNELLAYQYELTPSRNVRMNAPCFPAGTSILLADGSICPIEQVQYDYAIISHEGKAQSVYNVMERPYKGELVCIKASGIPEIIEATPEHPFWAKRRTCKTLQRRSARKEFPAEWVDAKDLKAGDWLAVPKRKELEPTQYTDEQLYAFGFWLAEGHILNGWGGDTRGLGLTNTDIDRLKQAATVIESIYPVDMVKRGNQYSLIKMVQTASVATYVERDRGNNSKRVCEWAFYSRNAGHFFKENFGEFSDGKFIAERIYQRSGLLSLVAGFIDGDGSQRIDGAGDVNLYTTSERLAWQLRQILIDSGIWCTLRKNQRKPFVNSRDGRRCENPKPQWIINIKASFLHLLPTCKVKVPEHRHLRHVQEDEDAFYTPVREISRRDYDGPVYNLAVENDNSYIAGGVAVHNCGMHDDTVIALALSRRRAEASSLPSLLPSNRYAGIARKN